MKKGFTIVEMLMVIAVLAVLTGIIATAATSVIRRSRERKTEALRIALQTGIATFYQQKGYWPPKESGKLHTWATRGLNSSDLSGETHVAQLEEKDYDELMQDLVLRCLNSSGNPVMDVSGFTATRQSATKNTDNDGNPKCFGEEVRSWVAKQRAKDSRGSTPKAKELAFGYSNSEKSYFRRFRIYYNADSDSVTVGYAKKRKPNGEWVDDK